VSVVADSTPLISLASIGSLDFLQSLFKKVCIPQTVYREVVIDGKGRTGSREVRRATWIERHSIRFSGTGDRNQCRGWCDP
jgi:predicted nucleic acid-binding protein